MNLNWPHIHLIINHAPVFAVMTGVVVLLLAMVVRRPAVLATACLFLIAGGVLAVPVYLTGEPTEEALEGTFAVSEALIEPHEEAALTALIGAIVVGALALVALVVPYSRGPRPAMALVAVLLAAGLVDAVLIGRAASLGGEVRHPEIRANAAATTQVDAVPTERRAHHDDDD